MYCMSFLNILEFMEKDSENSIIQAEKIDNSTFLKSMEQISYGRHFFIDINSVAQNVLHRHIVNDSLGSIVKQKNNYLMATSADKDITLTAEALKTTYDSLQKKKIDMLYVGARTCVKPGSNKLPIGVQDWDNQVMEEFFLQLEKLNVPYIDSYESLSNAGGKWEEYFFKTDHHWTPEAAFEVYADTCKFLEAEYGWNVEDELFDIGKYQKREYKSSFLGAEGRRVGKYYVGLDDFTLITPSYDTGFTFYVPSKNIARKGDFQSALLDPEQPLGRYSYELNAYYKYIGGDYPEVQIINHNVSEGKILIVKDSFGIPYSAFLSQISHETTIVDLRYTEESFQEIVDTVRPDLVVFCYGPGYLGVPSMVSLD